MLYKSADPDVTNIMRYFPPGLVEEIPLVSGDFAFWSGDGSLSIGVERKRTTDLVRSLVVGGRLVQQIRDARGVYQVQYLVTEGMWRPGQGGLLEVWGKGEWVCYHPPIPYARLDNALNSLQVLEGVHIKRTSNAKETAAVLINLYHWWQKPLDSHTTTKVFHNPAMLVGKVSLVRRVASELPGVGWEISGEVEKHFGSVDALVYASEKEWAGVRLIGKKKAKAIVEALRGNREVREVELD